MCTHAYTCIHMHTHAYTCIHMHTHAYTCIHMHTHVYTCIHMHTHAYTCIHIHAYTCMCMHPYLYYWVKITGQRTQTFNVKHISKPLIITDHNDLVEIYSPTSVSHACLQVIPTCANTI